ncbi:MAG TPA: VOC family protein [Candidatus Angelobacter sp.]|jgi:catechol 2,3-dioxygenase-like lactoylglutathione lyase family enzyme|nr:VOC family protein [Candidatus Angelobacter sp.]
MKLENVVPMMTVTDLDETLHFYREILGFEFTAIKKTLARLIQ